jgi:hypothetical protein
MSKSRISTWTGLLLALALSACGDSREGDQGTAAPQPGLHAQPPAAIPPVDWTMVEARLAARADSVDTLLRRVPALNGTELGNLRRDVNAVHTSRAQALGVRVRAEVDPHVEAGRLVPLEQNTRYWQVDSLDYSVPFVTPSKHALLVEIGERFQARLDSVGLPPYRMIVTSVLRTPDMQARLRRSNPNAAAGVSSHEFGTTVDLAYRRFAPPARPVDPAEFGVPTQMQPELQVLSDSLMFETARLRGAEMQAVLGRVLLEMRREGKVLVIMERAQTVYHTTVARRLEPAGPVPSE